MLKNSVIWISLAMCAIKEHMTANERPLLEHPEDKPFQH
jgi:hypothetical protein